MDVLVNQMFLMWIVLIASVLGVATGAFLEASMVLWRINSMEARKLENYLSVKEEKTVKGE